LQVFVWFRTIPDNALHMVTHRVSSSYSRKNLP